MTNHYAGTFGGLYPVRFRVVAGGTTETVGLGALGCLGARAPFCEGGTYVFPHPHISQFTTDSLQERYKQNLSEMYQALQVPYTLDSYPELLENSGK